MLGGYFSAPGVVYLETVQDIRLSRCSQEKYTPQCQRALSQSQVIIRKTGN